VVIDFVAGILGAKLSGASWFGVLGALVGSMFGFIILNIPGLFLGSFAGAFLGEYLKYQKTHQAMKAGVGTILGIVFGTVIKVILAFMMIGVFLWGMIRY